uniref:Uncharacterized protein LOC105111904 isoform X2 n=1 Tax=Rhizophora mucronata TaxID=61149 RepID=A0A2P2JWV1_RHIMU
MAGICSPNPTVSFGRNHRVRCCLGAVDDDSNKTITRTRGTPQVLKLAVSGVTELLRLFSFSNKDRLDGVSYKEKDELPVSSVDDVILNLKSEYDNAYFVTGIFTSAIYAKDCIFEDPTISFRGENHRHLELMYLGMFAVVKCFCPSYFFSVF